MVFPRARNPHPTRPGGIQGDQRLVQAVVAVGEGGPERLELRLEVARAESHHHATTAQDVEGGDPLGRQEGIAIGEDEQVGVEQDPAGGRSGERQRHQWIQGVVAPVGQPVVPGERVLGGVDGAESDGLGGGGQLADGAGGEELLAAVDPVGGQPERDAHRFSAPVR
jgi:hypothetical protein